MNERMSCLLSELLQKKENDYLSLQTFSEQHNISIRTIQKDLVLANEICERFNISIETRYGKKVQLVGGNDGRRLLKQFLSTPKTMTDQSVLYRRKEILLKLLTTSGTFSIRQLSEDYFVSPSSIVKDLKYIEEYLGTTTLSLRKNNFGTSIEGDRKSKLKLAESIIYELVRCDTRAKDSIETIGQLFPEINVQLLSKNVRNVEREYQLSIYETTFLGLIIHLLLLINGNIECHGTHEEIDIPIEIKEFCESLGEFVFSDFGKNLSNNEKRYLEQYLTCMGVNSLSIKRGNYDNMTLNPEIEIFITRFLDILSDTFVLPLQEDKELIQRLRWHCYAMFDRIDQSREIENALIDEIKENYPAVFSGVLFALQEAHPKKYFDFSQEEIGFLVIYMQAAIERNAKGKSAIIVCVEGLVFSELIYARIKKYIPSLHIVRTASFQELSETDLTEIDFIISTSHLSVEKPVIVISPILETADIDKITIKMREISLKYSALREMIDEKLIFLKEDFGDKNQVLRFLCNKLIEQNAVADSFFDSVINREKKLSTELGDSFAIPHGEMTHVFKSKLVICTLKHPILWKKKSVDCVFLLAIHAGSKKRNREFFAEFYDFIQIPKHLLRLRESENIQQVMDIFTS